MALNTNAQHVIRAFQVAEGRLPTQEELNSLQNNSSLSSFIRANLDLKQNSLTHEQFVRGLYENAGITADDEGVLYWTNLIRGTETGQTLDRAQVIEHFQFAAAQNHPTSDVGTAVARAETAGLNGDNLQFRDPNQGEDGDGEGPSDFDGTITFNTSVEDRATNKDESGNHAIFNIGLNELVGDGNKMANTTTTADYTFVLKDQLGHEGVYQGLFLSPVIAPTIERDSSEAVLRVRVADRLAPADNVETTLDSVSVPFFTFFLNGEVVRVESEAMAAASNYDELFEAVKTEVERMQEAGQLTPNLSVTLGENFTEDRYVRQQDGTRVQEGEVVGKEIVINTTAGELQEGTIQVISASGRGIDPVGYGLDTFTAGRSTEIIETNLTLNNVGYGSQGGSINLTGQSQSGKGIEKFNIEASNGVWLSNIMSAAGSTGTENVHLREIDLKGQGYFNVGKQEGEKVVADADAGLVDVRKFAAGNFGGNIQLDATITSDIIRDFDLVDTDGNAARDNVPAQYDLGRGDDRLLMEVAVEALAHEDFELNINTNGGDDYVHLKLSGDLTLADNQFANHVDRDNIKITATGGDNTIWTEGAGKATVTTGGGRDTIYTDNSWADSNLYNDGKATWVLNAQNADVNDLRGNAASSQLLLGAKVQVTFAESAFAGANANTLGLESKLIDIPVNSQGYATQAQVNQAIKEAINVDAVLSKLLIAKDGPHNTLIIESLIDGEFAANDLNVNIIAGSTDSDDDNFIGNNALNQLATQLRADSVAPNLNETQVQTALDNGRNSMNTQYNVQQGIDGVTTGGGGTAATATLDLTGIDLSQVVTITGLTNADTYDGSTPDMNALISAITASDEVASATWDAGSNTLTVTYVADVEGANAGTAFSLEYINTSTANQTVNAVITAGDDGTPITGDVLTGDNSDAASFVTVNAGAGQDVIVLSTSNNAEETVVFTGNFGHNTIVNFNANGSSDTLDFTSYLTARTSTSGSDFSAVTPAANVTAVGANALEAALNTSANSIINLTGLSFDEDNTWDNLNASVLESIMKGGEGYGIAEDDFDTDNLADATDLYSNSNKAVVFIENSNNEGEYKVFEIASSEDSLDNVSLIGTVDFGDGITFNAVNFAGAV